MCDGFVSMPPLISLITCRVELHCLITCRVELHCFAWSFVSHVDVRWLLVSYQAFVVLRCRCWCVLSWIKPSERFPSSLGSVVTIYSAIAWSEASVPSSNGMPTWIAPRLALPNSLFNSAKACAASGPRGKRDASNKGLAFCEKFGIHLA